MFHVKQICENGQKVFANLDAKWPKKLTCIAYFKAVIELEKLV